MKRSYFCERSEYSFRERKRASALFVFTRFARKRSSLSPSLPSVAKVGREDLGKNEKKYKRKRNRNTFTLCSREPTFATEGRGANILKREMSEKELRAIIQNLKQEVTEQKATIENKDSLMRKLMEKFAKLQCEMDERNRENAHLKTENKNWTDAKPHLHMLKTWLNEIEVAVPE